MKNPFALIIEDDENLGHILSEALRAAEFETEIVRDGNKAIARLAATNPAIVILDLHLPHVSGKDILYQIRSDTRLTDTRIMLATADALMAAGLRDHVDLVLLKPISFSQMRDLARRLRPSEMMG